MSLLDQARSQSTGTYYPKMLLYGGPGVGKTVTALILAKWLKKRLLAIDGDGGCNTYRWDPDWADVFDVVVSSEPVEICMGLDELLNDPKEWGILLLDSISTVWRDGEYSVEAAARRKIDSKKGVSLSLYESAWNLSLWNPTKRLAWQIANNIKRLRMPIVCTARKANKWEHGAVVGDKPEGDAQIGHEFDIVANLSQYHPQSPRVAVIEKDRLHRLPTRIEGDPGNPFWLAAAIMEAYGKELGTAAEANPRASNEQIEELYRLQADALDKNPGVTHALIVDWIRSSFQEDRYEDLSPDQARAAIQAMKARLGQE